MKEPRFSAIEIKAFRGMQSVRLDGLSRVNIFVGRNNAGKTSVLEAIAACCHPVNGEAWLEMVRRRGSRQTFEEQFAWLFPRTSGGPMGEALELIYERPGTPSQWRVTGHLTRRQQIAADEAVDVESSLASATRTVTKADLHLEPIGAPADGTLSAHCEFVLRSGENIPRSRSPEDVHTVVVTPITHRSEVHQIGMMSGIDSVDLRSSMISLLRNFDGDVESVEVYDPTGTRSLIRVWHQRTGPTPIAAFGDGFRRVLTYALALIRCRDGGVLLIDEIETAIHYSALRDVYSWLVNACEQYNVQLFVTTHSLEAIDALLDATPEAPDTVFFRLFDVGKGTQVLRLSETDLRTLREVMGDEVRG